MVRLLITAILLASGGWGGYWYVGSGAQKAAIEDWLHDRAQAGWVANYSSVSVHGFPNRFDTTVTDLELADPRYGWAWLPPAFQTLQLSYQPNHIIAVWPKSQTIATPTGSVAVTAEDMRASVVFQPDSDLALNRATVTLKDVRLNREDGWNSSVEQAVLATRQSTREPFAHDIALDAKNFTPSEALKAQLDPEGLLPTQFDAMHVETTAAFDRPWDRRAIEAEKPVWTRLDINTFDAQWGDLGLKAVGSVELDREGYPTGSLDLQARNWRQILDLAVAAGSLTPEMAATLDSGLSLFAMMSGNKDTLDVPLQFSDRIMFLGPIPVGEAPRLQWD